MRLEGQHASWYAGVVVHWRTFSIVARDSRTGDLGVAAASVARNFGLMVTSVSRDGAIAAHGFPDVSIVRRTLAHRRGYCHTGSGCCTWCGHERGIDGSVSGVGLADSQVIGAMAGAFRRRDKLPAVSELRRVCEAVREDRAASAAASRR
jgi:uncharacterized Ntn-hydrolase superfamily protein